MPIFDWANERNLLRNLQRMHEELDRVWETVIRGAPELGSPQLAFPPVVLSESKEGYTVRAEIPGINISELDLSISGNSLSIKGVRKEEEGGTYHRREREAGSFERVIALPGPVDADKVEASYLNGVLKVTLSRVEAKKPRAIAIKPA